MNSRTHLSQERCECGHCPEAFSGAPGILKKRRKRPRRLYWDLSQRERISCERNFGRRIADMRREPASQNGLRKGFLPGGRESDFAQSASISAVMKTIEQTIESELMVQESATRFGSSKHCAVKIAQTAESGAKAMTARTFLTSASKGAKV